MIRHSLLALVFCATVVSGQTPGGILTLEQALDIAARANPDLQLARLRQAEHAALAAQTRSGLLPQLNGLVQTTYQVTNLAGIGLTFPGLRDRLGPFSTFDARPRLSQTVFDAALIASTRAAKERIKQAEEDTSVTRERVLGSVIQLYLQALQASSRLRAAEARELNYEAIRRQVADRTEAGTANKLDLARAVEQVQRERVAVAFARRDRDVITTQLIRALGLTTTGPAELAESVNAAPMPPAEDDALNIAYAARPEMRSLAMRRAVLERELQAASRQRWPKFGVVADAGAFGATIPTTVSTYLVAGTVTIPIYTGGRIENEVKAARLRLEQWEQERRQVEVAISQEVSQALLEVKAAERASGAAAVAAQAARDSLELARLRYEAGLATNLDVVTAQANLAQAEEEEIRTRFERLQARARLAQAQGNTRGFLAAR
jgi:outer membrane protein TolC